MEKEELVGVSLDCLVDRARVPGMSANNANNAGLYTRKHRRGSHLALQKV